MKPKFYHLEVGERPSEVEDEELRKLLNNGWSVETNIVARQDGKVKLILLVSPPKKKLGGEQSWQYLFLLWSLNFGAYLGAYLLAQAILYLVGA